MTRKYNILIEKMGEIGVGLLRLFLSEDSFTKKGTVFITDTKVHRVWACHTREWYGRSSLEGLQSYKSIRRFTKFN